MPEFKSVAGFSASCQFQVGRVNIIYKPWRVAAKCSFKYAVSKGLILDHVEMNFFRMAGTLVSGKTQCLFAIGANKKVGFL